MIFQLFFLLYVVTELLTLHPNVPSVLWKEVIARERPELFKSPIGIWENIVEFSPGEESLNVNSCVHRIGSSAFKTI